MMKRLLKTTAFFAVLSLLLIMPIRVLAQDAQSGQGAVLSISVDKESASLGAGEWLSFQTEITNTGDAASPPLVAHFNVASLQPGKHIDPEDWSPKRTQYLTSIQPGESVTLDWRVHTLFEGDFAVFVSLVSEDPSFETVSSPALHIHAKPDDILPMGKVIPVVATVPLFPLGLLVLTKVFSWRKR